MMLQRFWFKFELTINDSYPYGILIGCGVTAYNEEDALNLLKEKVFSEYPFPKIKKIVPNVDVRELDQNHVIPNMHSPTERGIWFPVGYK